MKVTFEQFAAQNGRLVAAEGGVSYDKALLERAEGGAFDYGDPEPAARPQRKVRVVVTPPCDGEPVHVEMGVAPRHEEGAAAHNLERRAAFQADRAAYRADRAEALKLDCRDN